MRESRSFQNLDSFGFRDEMVDDKKEAHGSPTSAMTKSSLLRQGRLPLSQEGSFVFRVGSKRHAVPLGDSFTNLGVVVAVELDEINLLTVDSVSLEKVEPFHSRITL